MEEINQAETGIISVIEKIPPGGGDQQAVDDEGQENRR